MNRKYVLMLTADERARLEGIVRTGKCAAWKIERAHALLKMDRGEDGPGWSDDRIADAFGMTTRILEKWRKRAVEEGLDMVLERQYAKQRPQTRKLDGDGEAELTRLACSQAPDDSVSWTLELLANKLVELRIVDTISRETVRRTLKKTNSSHGSSRFVGRPWCHQEPQPALCVR
jgi:transposase